MEGKHIAIQKCDGISRYLNYEDTHSIFSLVVAGQYCRCLCADFGAICDDGDK